MNYYKHHLGDYAAATRHLSLLEHGAYRSLIDLYYVTEKPLPADDKAVSRLVCARTKEERDAIAAVLGEFFQLESDGWHHTRCDEEINKANAKAEQNREFGKGGGRPRKIGTIGVAK